MKRSVFVSKLTEILNKYQYQDYQFHEEDVSKILQEMENLGMMPPHNSTGTFDNSWEMENT